MYSKFKAIKNNERQCCGEILLSINERILLQDIKGFCRNNKLYFKQNITIANELDISTTSVSNNIKKLLEKGLIKIEYKHRGGGGIFRLISLTDIVKQYDKIPKLIEPIKQVKKSKQAKEEYVELAKEFEQKIKQVQSSEKIANLIKYDNSWALELEKLNKKYSIEEIKKVLSFIVQDSFFNQNVKSIANISKRWKNGLTAFENALEKASKQKEVYDDKVFEDMMDKLNKENVTCYSTRKFKNVISFISQSIQELEKNGWNFKDVYNSQTLSDVFPNKLFYTYGKDNYISFDMVYQLAYKFYDDIVNFYPLNIKYEYIYGQNFIPEEVKKYLSSFKECLKELRRSK